LDRLVDDFAPFAKLDKVALRLACFLGDVLLEADAEPR